jgi:hypothetical protein
MTDQAMKEMKYKAYDDAVRLRAILFTLIERVFGRRDELFIKALTQGTWPENWAAEFERLLLCEEWSHWDDAAGEAALIEAAIKEFCERRGNAAI